MSRLAEIRSQLNQRGKSVVSYGADLVEWSAEKNLAVAGDIASFAVAQIRLPIEVENFTEYRAEVQESISGLSETLREHGQDYVAKLKDLPGDFREVVRPEAKKVARKSSARKAAPKKAAAKKSTVKKSASKKASTRSRVPARSSGSWLGRSQPRCKSRASPRRRWSGGWRRVVRP